MNYDRDCLVEIAGLMFVLIGYAFDMMGLIGFDFLICGCDFFLMTILMMMCVWIWIYMCVCLCLFMFWFFFMYKIV